MYIGNLILIPPAIFLSVAAILVLLLGSSRLSGRTRGLIIICPRSISRPL